MSEELDQRIQSRREFAAKAEHYHSEANKEMSRLYGSKGTWLEHSADENQGPAYSPIKKAILSPFVSQTSQEDQFFRTAMTGAFYQGTLEKHFAGMEKDFAQIKKRFPNLTDLELKGKESDLFIEFTMLHEHTHLRDRGLRTLSQQANSMAIADKDDLERLFANGTLGGLIRELKADAVALLVMDKKYQNDPDYQSMKSKVVAARMITSLASRENGEAHNFLPLYEHGSKFLKSLPTPTANNIDAIEETIEKQAIAYLKRTGISNDFIDGSEALKAGLEKSNEICDDVGKHKKNGISAQECKDLFGITSLETGLNSNDKITLSQIYSKREVELEKEFQLNGGAFAPTASKTPESKPTEPEHQVPTVGLKR